MDRVAIDLKHCYGIKALNTNLDYTKAKAYALYAPNGVMKSSLARTFQDASTGAASTDRIFPERATVRHITDETGAEIQNGRILVVLPYDEQFGPSARTSTLLVDPALRNEYTELHSKIETAREALFAALKAQARSKADFSSVISNAFTKTTVDVRTALTRIQSEVASQKDAPFANVEYDRIFSDKIVSALETKNLKKLVAEYINRYNELLSSSTYFKRGIFDYYNAGQIAKSLADNGFFKASHTVILNSSGEPLQITNQQELEQVIEAEKQAIITDAKLRKSFDEVAKQLDRNTDLREFKSYLMANDTVLSQLEDMDKFREDVLKSYIKTNESHYLDLMAKYQEVEKRKAEIEEEARKQRTQWEQVIDIFNDRFFVPFRLEAKNRVEVMLGDAGIIDLGFTYQDGDQTKEIGRSELLQSLSTGERKALYVLNVMFEVETRKKTGQETLLVVDDIADSFDYQNKYAIIQYLRDISEDGLFKQIILTHNFDFFRTIQSRFVGYSNCLMATKGAEGITLHKATGIKNIFVNDWRVNFYADDKKKVASIPFLRNLVEYTRGEADPNFMKLTNMLHWTAATPDLTITDLDAAYLEICGVAGTSAQPTRKAVDLIFASATECLGAGDGLHFANKVVLAIAIRLKAERFMIGKIADPAFVQSIQANQTSALLREYRKRFAGDSQLAILDKVALMTPENIHLNSFMYEPIIDMSDDHLKKLLGEVDALT